MAMRGAKTLPNNPTYTAITGANGLNEATMIPDLNAANGSELFKINSNWDPNVRQGIKVNKVFMNEFVVENIPITKNNTRIIWDFYTTHWTPCRNFYLDLPCAFLFAENQGATSGGAPTAPITGDILYQGTPATNTGNVQYSQPQKALSRLFRKLTIRFGNQVDILTADEQYPSGIAMCMNEVHYMPESLNKTAARQMGAQYTIQAPKIISPEMEFMKAGHFDIWEAWSFLINFQNPSLQPNTVQQERIRVPLYMITNFFRQDCYLPPGLKIYIEIEMPFTVTQPANAFALKNTAGNNFALLAQNSIQTAGLAPDYGPGTGFTAGLLATVLQYENIYCTTIGHELYPEIANSIRKLWVEKPLIFNNEKFDRFFSDWSPSQTDYTFILQPNINIAQQYYIGIVKTVSQVTAVPALSYPPVGGTAQNYYPARTVMDWEGSPLPLLLARLDVNLGSYPLKTWFNHQIGIIPSDVGNSANYFFQNNYTAQPENMNEDFKEKSNYKLGYALNPNMYENEWNNIDICNRCGFGAWIKFTIKPGDIDRGMIDSELGAHQIRIHMIQNTADPLWTRNGYTTDGTTKIVVWRKTQNQMAIDVANSVTITSWPAMIIGSNGTQVIANPPPSGANG
jgi:hypothetical protein